jgi:hypothetical protein
MGNQSLFRWPLICGGIVGFITALPFLNILNVCTCCVMVALAGFVAAWRASVDTAAMGKAFDVGQGTITGVLTGLVFGLVNGVVEVSVANMFPEMSVAMMESMRGAVENMDGVPPESLDQLDNMIDQMQNPVFSFIGLIVTMVKSIVLGGIFCTVGGLIGGAVFKKTPQEPAAPGPIIDPVE